MVGVYPTLLPKLSHMTFFEVIFAESTRTKRYPLPFTFAFDLSVAHLVSVPTRFFGIPHPLAFSLPKLTDSALTNHQVVNATIRSSPLYPLKFVFGKLRITFFKQ